MVKRKMTTAFIQSLAVISILGFLAVIGNSWLSWTFLQDNMAAFILIALGVGMGVEGQIRKWRTYPKGGISSNEVAHIVTGLVGITALMAGILSLLALNNPILSALRGWVGLVAIAMITLETWVVK